MNAKREQLEALISRGAEARLTADERATIQDALARDKSLAADHAAYARLNDLCTSTRVLPSAVDIEQIAADTRRAIRQEFESASLEDRAFDETLRDMVGDVPATNWQQFNQRVSSAVEAAADSAQPQTLRFPAFITWVAPLAAAAVLVFAFWGPARPALESDSNQPNNILVKGPTVVVEVDRPTGGGLVEISFDRTPPATRAAEDELLPGGTVIVNGTWPNTMANNSRAGNGVSVDVYYY